MSDEYEQHLKTIAKSFKNLNAQLLGFLLVAIGFLFSSDIILTSLYLFWTTLGLSVTFMFWVLSMIVFLSFEFHWKKTESDHEKLYYSLRSGIFGIGAGFVLLSWSLMYLTAYISIILQEEAPEINKQTPYFLGLIAFMIAGFIGREFYRKIKIPTPPKAPTTPEKE